MNGRLKRWVKWIDRGISPDYNSVIGHFLRIILGKSDGSDLTADLAAYERAARQADCFFRVTALPKYIA